MKEKYKKIISTLLLLSMIATLFSFVKVDSSDVYATDKVKSSDVFTIDNADLSDVSAIDRADLSDVLAIDRADLSQKILDNEAILKSSLRACYEIGDETDRFIYKFKDGQMRTITLELNVNIDEFIANEIRINNDIEYIQPDYILTLNEVSKNDYIYLTVNELNNKTDTESPDESVSENTEEVDGLDNSLDRKQQNELYSDNQLSVVDIDAINNNIHDVEFDYEFTNIVDNDLIEITNIEILDRSATTDNEYFIKKPKSHDNQVIVAVIDSEVDIMNKDIKNYIINKSEYFGRLDSNNINTIDDIYDWDFTEKKNHVHSIDPFFADEHGSHITGIILGFDDVGYYNRQDYNIAVLPIKAFCGVNAYTSNIVDSIRYANSIGAKIINCSWSGPDYNPALLEAMSNSEALFVCSAGNGGENLDECPVYPAAFSLDNIINVTSIDNNGGLCFFSNFGQDTIDIAAPGYSINNTNPESEFKVKSGTSISTAIVSSVAARISCENPNLTAYEIKNRIINGADKVSNLDGFIIRASRLNPDKAISGNINNNIITSLAANNRRIELRSSFSLNNTNKRADLSIINEHENLENLYKISSIEPLRGASSLPGSGTRQDPFLISNAQELNMVNNNLSACYKLISDIDLEVQGSFTPIGSRYMPFEGEFDGNGYIIRNLSLYTFCDDLGLFGYTYNASIRNLSVDAVIFGLTNVGILSGFTVYGEVTNCSVSGVAGGCCNKGGLIGYSYGTTVTKSSAINTWIFTSEHNAISCYTGGFIGYGYQTNVSNCYNDGCVGAMNGAKGFGSGMGFKATNCYTSCRVDGQNPKSFTTEGVISGCYYNSDFYPGSDNFAIGKNSSQLKQKSTFAGWDFNNIWDINELQSYPFLRKEITISYSGNGNTGGSAPPSQKIVANAPIILRSNVGLLLKAGYIFGGWNTDECGTGITYAEGETVIFTVNTLLYAKWIKLNMIQFTITNNSDHLVTLNAQNVSSFTNKAIAITFYSTELKLIDVAAQVQSKHVVLGLIPGTGITITEITPTKLKLLINKSISQGNLWSGVLTVLRFTALKNGIATVIIE